jgi:hypothetical protein
MKQTVGSWGQNSNLAGRKKKQGWICSSHIACQDKLQAQAVATEGKKAFKP